MAEELAATLAFGCLVLAVLTAGLGRVVWVVLFDEYIGFAKPPPDLRFEVVAVRGVRVDAGGRAQVQLMTPGR